MSNETDKDYQLARQYVENPDLRFVVAVLKTVPIVGTGVGFFDEVFLRKSSEIIQNRELVLYEELAKNGLFHHENSESDDFIHRFSCIYQASIRTHQSDKIRRFANLLINSVKISTLDLDRYEEYVHILEDLSVRELGLLLILQSLENSTSPTDLSLPNHKIMENKYNEAKVYWQEFLSKSSAELNIELTHIGSILSRLSSRGLFDYFSAATMGISSSNSGYGQTTAVFNDFAYWITTHKDSDEPSD